MSPAPSGWLMCDGSFPRVSGDEPPEGGGDAPHYGFPRVSGDEPAWRVRRHDGQFVFPA